MKLLMKMMLAVLVIGCLLPFTIIKGKDGKPLMSFSDLKMPELKTPDIDLPDAIPTPSLGGEKDPMSGKDVVYQWRDSQGNLNFSSTPPTDDSEYTVKGYDPNQNLIQAVKVKPPEPQVVEKPDVEIQTKLPEKSTDLGSAYDPEKIKSLMKDAKNVEQLLKDRMQQQEALIN